jgi:hypothetical protein
MNDVEIMRKASRKMGVVLVSTCYFVQQSMQWLKKTHGEVRVQCDDFGWYVEPLDDEGDWTGRDGGYGETLQVALADAVCNCGKVES